MSGRRSPMWRRLRWEWLVLRRERLAPLILAVLVVAAVIATDSGQTLVRQWQTTTDRYAASAAEGDAALARTLAVGKSSGEEAGSVRTTYLRPVPPLLALAGGRAMLDPIATTVGPTDQIYHLFRDYQTDNPWTLAIGRFDWAFVLAVVVPLLIIALGHDLLARDRDLGVDRQLAIVGIDEGELLKTRLLARAVPLTFVILVLVVVCALAIGVDPGGRLAVVLMLAVGGMAFWWGLVAFVALRSWSAVRSATVLIGVWVVAAFAIPALAGDIAQALAPSSSRLELTALARTAEIHAQTNAGRLVDAYLAQHPGLPPHPDEPARRNDGRFAVPLAIDQDVAPALARFRASLDRQRDLVTALAFLSPTSAQQGLTIEAAGTGYLARSLFEGHADRHYEAWRDTVARFQFARRPLNRAMINGLPVFQAPPLPSLSWARIGVFWAMALMPGACAGLVAAARSRKRRANSGEALR